MEEVVGHVDALECGADSCGVTGVAHGDLHLIERFRLSTDGNTLYATQLSEDPSVFAGKAARPSDEDRHTPSDFFPRLASHWKRAYTQHPAGWTAWVLSPDMKLPSAMRLKESRRVPMWNGPIECRLFRFDLVAGSARAPKG